MSHRRCTDAARAPHSNAAQVLTYEVHDRWDTSGHLSVFTTAAPPRRSSSPAPVPAPTPPPRSPSPSPAPARAPTPASLSTAAVDKEQNDDAGADGHTPGSRSGSAAGPQAASGDSDGRSSRSSSVSWNGDRVRSSDGADGSSSGSSSEIAPAMRQGSRAGMNGMAPAAWVQGPIQLNAPRDTQQQQHLLPSSSSSSRNTNGNGTGSDGSQQLLPRERDDPARQAGRSGSSSSSIGSEWHDSRSPRGHDNGVNDDSMVGSSSLFGSSSSSSSQNSSNGGRDVTAASSPYHSKYKVLMQDARSGSVTSRWEVGVCRQSAKAGQGAGRVQR